MSCLGIDSAGLARRLQRVGELTPSGLSGLPQSPAIAALIQGSVAPHTLSADGRYTEPRSYGVYEVWDGATETARFYFGNHPIRHRELKRAYGSTRLVATFLERRDAEQLTGELNG